MLLLDLLERALAGRRLADDVDTRLFEQSAQASARELVIVDEQYARGRSEVPHTPRVYV